MTEDVARPPEVAMPEPDEIGRFAERLSRFERHGELVERARSATGFSTEVVRKVVEDHLERREQVARELAELYPSLEALQTSLVRDRDRQRSEAESVVFRLDEIELRRTIGEIDGSVEEEVTLRQAIASTDRERARAEEVLARVQELVERWREGWFEPGELAIEAEEEPEEPADEEEEPELVCAELILAEGSPEEQVIPLVNEVTRIGRGPHNDVSIRRDTRVSRAHLAIERRGDRLYARDLGAANPTLINGEEMSAERRLYGGEELILGETFLRVRLR